AGLAVLAFHRVGGDDALSRPDRADPADAALAVAELLLVDDQLLLPVLPLDQPWRPVAKPRVDIGGPQVARFEDMAICIDHVVGAGHRHSSGCKFKSRHPKPATWRRATKFSERRSVLAQPDDRACFLC